MGASALCFLMLGFALSSACTSAPPLALSRPAHQDDGRAGAGCGGSWGARWDAGALGARCTAGKFALSLRGGGGPPKVASPLPALADALPTRRIGIALQPQWRRRAQQVLGIRPSFFHQLTRVFSHTPSRWAHATLED